jgi:hypothetical protein
MDDLRLGECWERDGFVILPGHLSPGDLAPPERAQYLPRWGAPSGTCSELATP